MKLNNKYLLLIFLLFNIVIKINANGFEENGMNLSITSIDAKNIIKNIDRDVILLIKNRNFIKLTSYIHPINGVRITLFNDITDDDVVLFRNSFLSTNKKYKWGIEWAKGSIIELNINDIFNKYLYKKDLILHKTLYNPSYDEISDYGFSNEYVFYNNCISVYHLYEGSETSYYLDWYGLKIIYQKYIDDKWYITGLIYCERVF